MSSLGKLLDQVIMVTQSTDIEMKEDLEFSDAKEEAAYWRQMAEEYAQKWVPLFLLHFNIIATA